MLYLSSFIPSSMTNPHSHPRFVRPLALVLGPPRTCRYPRGPRVLLYPCTCGGLFIFSRGLIVVLSKVYSPDIGLVPTVHILGFLASHNGPLKPHFPFFLGKGGFGKYGEAFWHAPNVFPHRDVFSTDLDMVLTLWNQRRSSKC